MIRYHIVMDNQLSHAGVRDKLNVVRLFARPGPQSLQRNKYSDREGFTLIELMVVLAITGILISLAAPEFNGLITNSKLDGGVDKISRAMSFARNLSLNNGTNERVVICPTGNPEADSPTCLGAATTDYQTGWIVFVDCDNDEIIDYPPTTSDCDGNSIPTVSVDDAEQTLQIQSELQNISLSSANNNRVVFNQFGQAQNLVSFNIDKDGVNFATVAINNLGRMNVTHNPSY